MARADKVRSVNAPAGSRERERERESRQVDRIVAIARIAAEANEAVENIGARRLSAVMEKLLEDVSFDAEDRGGSEIVIDAAFLDA